MKNTGKESEQMRFAVLMRNFTKIHLPVHRKMSDETIRAYKASINAFRCYLRDIKGIPFTKVCFDCFRRDTLYEFLSCLRDERKNSARTLNLRLAAIKAFLRYCSDEDFELTPTYLSAKTIHAFTEVQKTKVEYLTQKQMELLLSLPDVGLASGRRNRFFMIFTYETGARLREVLSVTLDDIDRSGEFIQVRIMGKGSRVRTVPLMPEVAAHLNSYLREFHPDAQPGSFLFYTVHDGQRKRMKPATVDAFLKKYARIAVSIDPAFPQNLHCHMLRHSIAMAMYKKGVPISYIRDFLGHSHVSSTSIYAYADGETIANALESVGSKAVPKNARPPEKKWRGSEEELISFCGLDD